MKKIIYLSMIFLFLNLLASCTEGDDLIINTNPNGTVDILVQTEDGQAIEGATYTLSTTRMSSHGYTFSPVAEGTGDKNGKWSTGERKSANYHIRIETWKNDLQYTVQKYFQLFPGDNDPIVLLPLEEKGDILIIIKNTLGNTIPGATVALLTPYKSFRYNKVPIEFYQPLYLLSKKTDADGKAEFLNMPSGGSFPVLYTIDNVKYKVVSNNQNCFKGIVNEHTMIVDF